MSTLPLRISSVVAAAALIASCTLQEVSQPSPTGPSTLGLSLNLSASPDILPEDGVSTSVISIVARDANGQPKPGVTLRVDTVVGSTIVDYGELSARTVTTNGNGQAVVTFTAPRAARPGVDTGAEVDIAVRQIGTDFGSTIPSVVRIRLVPETTANVPGAPRPNFFFSPTSPSIGTRVSFDATSSTDDGVIVDYRWDYGDGEVDNQRTAQVTKDYTVAGTYLVTLTVTDNAGLKASISRSITVAPSS